MWAKLSLQAKLMTAFGLVSCVLFVAGALSFWSTAKIVTNYEHVVSESNVESSALAKMQFRANDLMRIAVRAATIADQGQADQLKNEYENDLKHYADADKLYLGFHRGEKEQALYDKMNAAWHELLPVMTQQFELALHRDPAKRAEVADLINNGVRTRSLVYRDAVQALLDYQEFESRQWTKTAQTNASQGKRLNASLVGFGFLLALFLGWISAHKISRAIGQVCVDMAHASNATASAGQQLSAASQQLSSGATEAAASLEETVASLEELSSMVKLNAGHAAEANSLSQKSREAAERGEHELNRLMTAMGELSRGSKKIEEIIGVIDEIAFQTNLLALNAAVEAARAGEQGKGFAVVAEAVRGLAQRSGEAAKEINALIRENVASSEHGASLAGSSATTLREIVSSVIKVSDLNNEIASASQEQATGIEQIGRAMNQLDQATQTNAASSEEVAASAEEIASQSKRVDSLVEALTELIDGEASQKNQLRSPAPVQLKVTKTSHAATGVAGKHHQAQAQTSGRTNSSKASQLIPFDDEAPPIGKADGF